jgi:hypothetical protein
MSTRCRAHWAIPLATSHYRCKAAFGNAAIATPTAEAFEVSCLRTPLRPIPPAPEVPQAAAACRDAWERRGEAATQCGRQKKRPANTC